jgi:hypothetical protein
LKEYPQVKRGSTHSRSEATSMASATRIAQQIEELRSAAIRIPPRFGVERTVRPKIRELRATETVD